MRAEEIDALLGGEAQRLADKYTSVPLDFMDGYGWAVTQICRLFPEVVPVRHGKWIIRDNPGTGWYRVTCSECGEDVTSTAPCIGFFPNAKVTWNYCPECGARMDEE